MIYSDGGVCRKSICLEKISTEASYFPYQQNYCKGAIKTEESDSKKALVLEGR